MRASSAVNLSSNCFGKTARGDIVTAVAVCLCVCRRMSRRMRLTPSPPPHIHTGYGFTHVYRLAIIIDCGTDRLFAPPLSSLGA